MFCNKAANKIIVFTHRRALSAVQMVFSQSYEELLVLNKAETIHKKNLRLLLIEVYKSVSRLNPEFMSYNFFSTNAFALKFWIFLKFILVLENKNFTF